MKKTFSNAELISVINSQNDAQGKALRNKRLPIKVLYAMNKNVAALIEAYKPYEETRAQICKDFDVDLTAKLGDCEDPDYTTRMTELLGTTTEVEIHAIKIEDLDACGKSPYDALTCNDFTRLSWMIDEEEN